MIKEYNIEKALIISDDLDFIVECQSLKDVEIFPAFEAIEEFDYSVLYKIPQLKSLYCKTRYGDCGQYKTTIDYSKITGLEKIFMEGEGHLGYEKLSLLKELWISDNKKIKSIKGLSSSSFLQELTFLKCGIQSLDGIEEFQKMKALTLWNNYSLNDISALSNISDTLTELSIDSCGKITDFSVLSDLVNLEYLHLDGNNVLPDLTFLINMKRLKIFTFTMNVLDGDLNYCSKIPFVSCRNRKHYNLKDKDLPKNMMGNR